VSKHFLELISLWVAPFARGHGAGDTAARSVRIGIATCGLFSDVSTPLLPSSGVTRRALPV
jgi:hypothetical protein